MSPRLRVPLSRRSTVAGAVAVVATLSGCDLGDARLPGASPSPTPATDPDATLVDAVRAELDELFVLVSTLSARVPGLRRPLAGLLAMHTSHRAVLTDAPEIPEPSAPGGDPAELWALVVPRERQAQRRLADWAVEAQSGSLARLLASMSAGIAAHLAAATAPEATS